MEILHVAKEKDQVVFTPVGVLGLSHYDRFRSTGASALVGMSGCRIDFSEVSAITAPGIGILLVLRDTAYEAGIRSAIVLAHCNRDVRVILDVCGFASRGFEIRAWPREPGAYGGVPPSCIGPGCASHPQPLPSPRRGQGDRPRLLDSRSELDRSPETPSLGAPNERPPQISRYHGT